MLAYVGLLQNTFLSAEFNILHNMMSMCEVLGINIQRRLVVNQLYQLDCCQVTRQNGEDQAQFIAVHEGVKND